MSILTIILCCIAVLLPFVGLALMLGFARKGTTLPERRWRKRHGLLFWVLIPAVLGAVILLGIVRFLPDLSIKISVLLLGATTATGMALQRRHEEKVG
ncbi:MAG: GlsB/YeaQ/YmgE family stress response membrane protein [Armatimonadetes bacterium]|nr:GlsB/YeaQ/YmgE family stress response membrane protein [Armatimonadota bacterium]